MSFCPYVYIVLINNKTLLIEQTQYTRSILVAKKKKVYLEYTGSTKIRLTKSKNPKTGAKIL